MIEQQQHGAPFITSLSGSHKPNIKSLKGGWLCVKSQQQQQPEHKKGQVVDGLIDIHHAILRSIIWHTDLMFPFLTSSTLSAGGRRLAGYTIGSPTIEAAHPKCRQDLQ